MGSGGSKSSSKEGSNGGLTGDRERRGSHVDTNPPPKSEVLVPCGTCDRKFAADRIQRHAEVCSKTNNSKRSVFDVQGQRLEGTEAEEFKDKFDDMDFTRSADEWKKSHQKLLQNMKKDRRRSSSRPVSALDNIEFRHK